MIKEEAGGGGIDTLSDCLIFLENYSNYEMKKFNNQK
jgi:hypothetical protein